MWAQVEGGRAVPFSDEMVLCVCKLGYCCINLSYLPKWLPSLQSWESWGQEIWCISAVPAFQRPRERAGECRQLGCRVTPYCKRKKYNKNNTLEKAGKVAWSSFYYSEGSFVMSDKKFPPAGYCPPFISTPFQFPLLLCPLFFLGNTVYGLYHSQ